MSIRVIMVSECTGKENDFRVVAENLNRRIPGAEVAGVSPEGMREAVMSAVDQGVKRLILIPVSMPENVEILNDMESVKDGVEKNAVNISIEIVYDYTMYAALEDMIWESVTGRITDKDQLPELGGDIERLSHRIIDSKLETFSEMSREEKVVARRIIHSTADYSFAHTLRFSENAVKNGIDALRNKKPIICDVNMLKTAMTKVDSEIICLIADPDIIALAKAEKCTRAAAAMMTLGKKLDGAIVAVGNAPTAIWQLLKMDVKPAVVVGLPVGFVGARESKLELINSGHEYIANTTPKGGSPSAAAALNALALLAKEGAE